jgi:magnesium chelatase subunit I
MNEEAVIPRMTDIHAALPAITGKLELEYEGEQRGAENVAKDLIRVSAGEVFTKYLGHVDFQPIVEWFDAGGVLKLSDALGGPACVEELRRVSHLLERLQHLGIRLEDQPGMVVAGGEFTLEGLYAVKKISRSEEKGYQKADKPVWRDEDIEEWRTSRRRMN